MYDIDLANDFDSDRPLAPKNSLPHFYFLFVVDYGLNTFLRRVNGIGSRERRGINLATEVDSQTIGSDAIYCVGETFPTFHFRFPVDSPPFAMLSRVNEIGIWEHRARRTYVPDILLTVSG